MDNDTPTVVKELVKFDFSRMRTQEDYEDYIVEHAKYFAVVEIRPGAWRSLQPNFIRTEHPTLEEARAEAVRRHEAEAEPKRGSLIYAVADFRGASNMSTLVEAYPEVSGPYTRKGRDAKMKGKRPYNTKKYELPPPNQTEPSERYFESPEYAGKVANYVPAKKNQRALKYQRKRR